MSPENQSNSLLFQQMSKPRPKRPFLSQTSGSQLWQWIQLHPRAEGLGHPVLHPHAGRT